MKKADLTTRLVSNRMTKNASNKVKNLPPDFVGIGAVVHCNDRHGRNEWSGHIITGETKGLWITGHHKINKKTMIEANGRGRGEPLKWHTTQQRDDAIWRDAHEHRIREAIRGVGITDLKAIANIVGYDWNRVIK